MSTARRALLCLAFILPAYHAATAAEADGARSGEGGPATRIEQAYRRGVASADSSGERLEAATMRAESLDAELERSYQATLAWLIDGNGRVDALQREQAAWLDKHQCLIGEAKRDNPNEAESTLNLAARMTLERLDELRSLTMEPTRRDHEHESDAKAR